MHRQISVTGYPSWQADAGECGWYKNSIIVIVFHIRPLAATCKTLQSFSRSSSEATRSWIPHREGQAGTSHNSLTSRMLATLVENWRSCGWEDLTHSGCGLLYLSISSYNQVNINAIVLYQERKTDANLSVIIIIMTSHCIVNYYIYMIFIVMVSKRVVIVFFQYA